MTKTETVDTDSRGAAPDDPVLSVKRLPSGPLYVLDEFVREGRPLRWITVGRDGSCDLVIDDGTVSAFHCLIRRDGARTWLKDDRGKNGTVVNDVLVNGEAELRAGHTITLGTVQFVACGAQGDKEKPHVAVTDIDGLVDATLPLYGSQAKTAEAIGMSPSKLSRKLKNGNTEGEDSGDEEGDDE